MEITIGENYKLTSDRFNVVIEEKQVPKKKKDETEEKFLERTKEPSYTQVGFYQTVPKACVGLLRKDINESEATSIKELMKFIKETEERILNMEVKEL